jgi:hypothetical protein
MSEMEFVDPCPSCGALPCDQAHAISSESVADCAVSWLTTIGVEVGREEPDVRGRVRTLVQAATRHIRIKERVING